MSPTEVLLILLGVFWIGGGSFWLLKNRSYQVHQIPQFVMDLIGFPVDYSQHLFGRRGVPYALLMPNLIIFSVFTFIPVLLNLYISFTGGHSINLFSRPWIGWGNFGALFDCETYLDVNSCGNDAARFWGGMWNTFTFVAIQVPMICAVSLVTALVLNREIRGRGFWRAIFFYPVMLSPVVIANIWVWILHRKGALNGALKSGSDTLTALSGVQGFDTIVSVLFGVLIMYAVLRTLRDEKEPSFAWAAVFGVLFLAVFVWSRPLAMVMEEANLLNFLLGSALVVGMLWSVATVRPRARIGVMVLAALSAILLLTIQFDEVFNLGRFRPVNWLVTPNTGWPFFWLNFVYTWSHMGFYMLILLAGLQAIPKDLYDAAKMDATKPIRAFRRITLPLVMPTLTVVIILSLIRGFQIFDDAYLLTGGGPGSETRMVVQNIYESAFISLTPEYGLAAAGSMLMGLVIAIFTAVQLFVTRRQSEL